MLTIKKELKDGVAAFALAGRLDTMTSPQLEEELKTALEETGRLDLDLDALTYISSAGLRVLLWAQKAVAGRGELKVRNVCEAVMDIFTVTGFDEILTIE